MAWQGKRNCQCRWGAGAGTEHTQGKGGRKAKEPSLENGVRGRNWGRKEGPRLDEASRDGEPRQGAKGAMPGENRKATACSANTGPRSAKSWQNTPGLLLLSVPCRDAPTRSPGTGNSTAVPASGLRWPGKHGGRSPLCLQRQGLPRGRGQATVSWVKQPNSSQGTAPSPVPATRLPRTAEQVAETRPLPGSLTRSSFCDERLALEAGFALGAKKGTKSSHIRALASREFCCSCTIRY